MERVISGKVDKSHYKAKFSIIWCFDNRYSNPIPPPGHINLFKEFVKYKGKQRFDLVEVAGGAKPLASPSNEEERIFVLGQLRDSITLHAPDEICLEVHAGCGKYNKAFSNSDEEMKFYVEELRKAEDTVRKFLNELGYAAEIEKYYADWDGLWLV